MGSTNPRDEAAGPAIRREALGTAARLVWDFLGLFAELRYAEANRYLAPGCRMQFPGGIEFTDCTALPTRSSAIYRWVHKVFEHFDEFETPAGTVVYNFGTLRGEWTDGVPFEGVRYIDRFLVSNGKITDQKVWNDLSLAASARNR